MSLENVKQSIQQKTHAEAQAIKESGIAEAERVRAQAKERIEASRKEHSAQTARLVEAMERKEHAASTFAQKSMLLEAKRKVIEAVFTTATDLLAELSVSERAALHTTLAKKAADSLSVASLHCNPKDKSTLAKIFTQAKIETSEQISGGFIADDATGTVRVDFTFETIMESVRERMLAELSERLFG